jgi:hypothetical protein
MSRSLIGAGVGPIAVARARARAKADRKWSGGRSENRIKSGNRRARRIRSKEEQEWD